MKQETGTEDSGAPSTGGPDASLSSRSVTLFALIYFASIPVDILPVFGGRTATPVTAFLLLIFWMIDQIRRPDNLSIPRLAVLALWAYCSWATVSLFWVFNQAQGLDALLRIISLLPLTVVLCSILPRIWLKALMTLGASTTVLAWIVLQQPADVYRAGRASIGSIDENVTALVLSVGLAALVHVALTVRGLPIVATTIAAVITAGAIVHTGSRSGFIALLAVLATTVMQSVARSRPSPKLLVGSLLCVLIALITFDYLGKNGQIPPRLLDMFTSKSGVDDSGRASILDLYLRTIDQWFLFGVGYGDDAVYLQRTAGQYLNAHNLFWKTWIELGIPGLVFLGGLFASLVVNLKRSVEASALLKMAGPILVFAYTLGGAQTSAFWFVIAFGLARAPLTGVDGPAVFAGHDPLPRRSSPVDRG